MKNCVFLIILLGFIRVVLSSLQSKGNHTEDVCTVSWFRRKRANAEYTRWRFNTDTTPEFIVKVLDDDLPVGTTKHLTPVNILAVTPHVEKIVVGGAVLSTTTSSALPRDYTRFMPPTHKATAKERVILPFIEATTGNPSNLIEPILPDQPPTNKVIQPPFFPPNSARTANRDESPPASPQFLHRTQVKDVAPPRQFAPVAPVAFTRPTTGTPLKPPVNTPHIPLPTRTSEFVPLRTQNILEKLQNMDDLSVLEDLGEKHPGTENLLVTRTKLKEAPFRTDTYTTIPLLDEELEHLQTSADIQQFLRNEVSDLTESDTEDNKRNQNSKYNSDIFYNSDYRNKKEIDVDGKIEYGESQDSNLVKPSESDMVSSLRKFMEEPEQEKEPEPEPETGTSKSSKTFEVYYPSRSDTNVVVIKEEPKMNQSKQDSITRRREPICNMIKLRPLDFKSPRTLPEIEAQLKQWTEESPMAKWADITEGNLTSMENPIYVMIVDDPSAGQIASAKHNVLLIAGISGRDQYAVSAAMFVLYQLIERSDSHHDLLSKFRFYVIPVFNPDGYDYSLTFPHRRSWVKNLRQSWEPCQGHEACQQCSLYGIRCIVSPCYGVNLDRNFEYQWIPPERLQLVQECGTLYAGTRQMSEVETQALNAFLHQQHLSIKTFIAFKEGGVLGVMYPYSHTRKRRSFDQLFRYRAGRAAAAAGSVSGRKYVAGQTSEFLPLYAGGIEDWADGHLGIDDTYTIMLARPVDPPTSKSLAEKVIHEAFAATDSLLLSSDTDASGREGPHALVKNYIPQTSRARLNTVQHEVSLTFVTSFLISYLLTRIL
ncbi:hypothetical protein O0L34_g4972 [Tuta absoluta]|nr:hypothetical protein O0L34_g4972 [Tuta absoluta]